MSQSLPQPGDTVPLFDAHGGFTIITNGGTLWRPGYVAAGRGDTFTVTDGPTPANYQGIECYSVLGKLPRYSYPVVAWYHADGRRIA